MDAGVNDEVNRDGADGYRVTLSVEGGTRSCFFGTPTARELMILKWILGRESDVDDVREKKEEDRPSKRKYLFLHDSNAHRAGVDGFNALTCKEFIHLWKLNRRKTGCVWVQQGKENEMVHEFLNERRRRLQCIGGSVELVGLSNVIYPDGDFWAVKKDDVRRVRSWIAPVSRKCR